MGDFELTRFANGDELARAAAAAWLTEVELASRAGRSYCVALSGGRIARNFFSAAAAQAGRDAGSLGSVHFFWGDERCVPPDDAESNFGAARELLFAPLTIPASRIHRIRGEDAPDAAAAAAATELCDLAPCDPAGQPVLDLILLGMGEDGHVASLFPGEAEAVMSSPSVFRAVTAVKPPPRRITMGYAAITAARQVWVLASGAGKETALRQSLEPEGQTPLARVLRQRDHTRILSDIKARRSCQTAGFQVS